MPMVCLAQTMQLSCVEIKTISKWTKAITIDPRHVGVTSVGPKMVSEPMVRSAQTVHLSCVKINTTSKQTETIFLLIYST
jgi:hypothetical protein